MGFLRNPVIRREIEHRMRDNRTYFIPTVLLALLGLLTAAVYATMTLVGRGHDATIQGWQIGLAIFHAQAFLLMALMVLLVPSISAGAITSERDRGTLVPLLVTPMSRVRIAVGKWISSVLYILLLLITAIPFGALASGFGGVTGHLLLSTWACLITTVLFLSSMGLMVSTLVRRTVPAMLLAYGLVAFAVIGTAIVDGVLNLLNPAMERIVVLYANPFTPLVLNLEERFSTDPAMPVWWWTPVIHLALSAVFITVAGYRISRIRE